MRYLLPGMILCAVLANVASPADEFHATLTGEDIRIRDPFIFAYRAERVYLMYAQNANRQAGARPGVEVYASRDLVHWTQPRCVLLLPESAQVSMVWAPEMHEYRGKYYLFVTLTLKKPLPTDAAASKRRLPMRGTHVFVSASPYGPFLPLKATSHTPENWSALDGTLYVDKETPYMVFCHEWVQIVDGTIDFVPLKADLSDVAGAPEALFHASIAPGAKQAPNAGKVTDGCFLYKSEHSGKLFMMWSTFIPGKDYCVVLAESESGKVAGPWKRHRLLYTQNGGHSMIFKSFDGDLLMALHQPNRSPMERLRLFRIVEQDETLEVKEQRFASGKD